MEHPDEVRLQEAEEAFRLQPWDSARRRRFARELLAAGETRAAHSLIRDGLPPEQLGAIGSCIHKLFDELFGPNSHSDWRFLAKGTSNLALIRHEASPVGPLFTKVLTLGGRDVWHELAINRALMGAVPPWDRVTPRVYDVRVDLGANLALITSEFFDGRFVGPDIAEGERFAGLLSLLTQYASPEAAMTLRALLAPHERSGMHSRLDRNARDWQRIGRGLFRHQQKMSRVVLGLRWLDTPTGSKLMFDWIARRLKGLDDSGLLRSQWRDIERTWRRHRAWRWLDPARDFTLAHADFGTHNVMVNNETNTWAVIDFNSLIAAPAGIDLAGALGRQPFAGTFMQERVLPGLDECAPPWLWNPRQQLLFHLSLLAHKLSMTEPNPQAHEAGDLEQLLDRISRIIHED